MHHRTIGAMILALVAAKGISAEDSSATLSELVDAADRIAVGDVGTMRRVIEEQVVHTRDGEEITGKFIFTYVDVTPTEHIVGGQVSTVTVRLLGGLHPDGTKVTTYLQAPSLSSEEKVLLFLKQAPERGPNQEVVHSSADWCDEHESEYRNLDQRTLASGDVDGYEFIYVDAEGIRATFGNDSASKIVAADHSAETDLARTQATVFPNPFNPEVTLTFQLEHSATVSVHIYDEIGQLVRVLAQEAVRSPGQYQYVWDGLDDDGRSEASGVYLLVLSIDGVKESRKLTLLH